MADYKTRLTIENPALLEKLEAYLAKHLDAPQGTWEYLGLKKLAPAKYLSELEAFNLVWKLTREFDQVAVGTCQYGDLALVDAKTSKAGKDNPRLHNGCGDTFQCWFNACVSTRVSSLSRAF